MFSAGFELKRGEAGHLTVVLVGSLSVDSTARIWRELEGDLRKTESVSLHVDASGLDHCDGARLALLQFMNLGGMTSPGTKVTIYGLRPEFEILFQQLTAGASQIKQPQPPVKAGLAEQVGKRAFEHWDDLKENVAFIGELSSALFANLAQPKKMRWPEVWRVFEVAGVNALPIVSLISLLVGIIIAFEAAGPFAIFGAQIFIANMLGIIMARELACLMTGIILAGRSGSAFAAELGTMKVNEELNALETMGLNPIQFLVVQRFLASVLLTPALTAYSIFVSISGGVLVMLMLGFPLVTIYNQMAQTLHYSDIMIGVGKAFIFGALISGIGCLRGLQTKKGPSAVGESTTRAVVSGILLIILADAAVAVI